MRGGDHQLRQQSQESLQVGKSHLIWTIGYQISVKFDELRRPSSWTKHFFPGQNQYYP